MASVQAPGGPPATTRDRLDRVLDRLSASRDTWPRVAIPDRIALLEACVAGVVRVAPDQVAEACRRRRIEPGSVHAGEEWLGGPMVTVHAMRRYVRALRAGAAPRPLGSRTGPGGEAIRTVFPGTVVDRFLYYSIRGEVWFAPGVEPTQGREYRAAAEGRSGPARLGVVLGAGNVSSIGPLDVLYKLFVENQVVVLKMNPVNEWLGPYLEDAFAPLVERGVLGFVYGGADVGDALCTDPRVEAIHLTGSHRTHDAIVWGADPAEAASRRAEGRPRIDVPITSELGSVTPVLVVPERWSDGDLEFQARHVASMVAHNGSFNCNAAKVLVLARGWPQREAFLARLEAALRRTPPRYAYYPGAEERWRGFMERYPQARAVGERAEGAVPWTVIPDVPPREGEYALSHEAFCGVLAVTTLDADDAPAFLDRAVDFANDSVWGTLSCVILAHPRVRRAHAAELDRACSRLRYGAIGINVWTGVNYSIAATTWGAFPGHPLTDIRSGRGVVHNAYLFDEPQKSILHAPFRIWPTPVWFADHRNLAALGEQLTAFEATRSPWRLARVALAGMRG